MHSLRLTCYASIALHSGHSLSSTTIPPQLRTSLHVSKFCLMPFFYSFLFARSQTLSHVIRLFQSTHGMFHIHTQAFTARIFADGSGYPLLASRCFSSVGSLLCRLQGRCQSIIESVYSLKLPFDRTSQSKCLKVRSGDLARAS